jgi:hypothetical protein
LAASTLRALVRGEEMGLSECRFVVAKMLSRSSSWGRSIDDFQRLLSWTMGAVRERPVWESVLGVTCSCSGSGVRTPWLALDLTDAGGEVFPWASGWGDMGSTLIRPLGRHLVAGWVADIAGWALTTLARMRSFGRGGDTAEGQQGRILQISVQSSGAGGWEGCRCGSRVLASETPVRGARGPRSNSVWFGVKAEVAQRLSQASGPMTSA